MTGSVAKARSTPSAALTLPVIPHLEITDTGLVDVDAFGFV